MLKVNEIICKICNKKFKVRTYRTNAKYCSYKCHGIAQKGNNKWLLGRKIPYNPHFKKRGQIPWNKQVKQEKKCLVCKKIMFVVQWELKNKKYCSNNCKDKAHSKRQRGSNSHFWKGGLTSKSKRIRNSGKFREWRLMVFGRDNYTCQVCKERGCYLEAHHILPFSQFPKERFNINNGITLCEKCHHKTYSYGNKVLQTNGVTNAR